MDRPATPKPFSIFLNLLSKLWGDEALTLHVLGDVALNILARAAEGAWGARGPWRARWALRIYSA